MTAPHFPETAWRTSSFSGANSNCVQVACAQDAVATRDSKNPTGPRLSLSPTTWAAFVHHVSG
jgi:hypothetical protein